MIIVKRYTWDGKKLEIYNSEDVFNRKIVIKNSPVEKYKKISTPTNRFRIYSAIVLRLEKYKRRGFSCADETYISDFYSYTNTTDLIGYDQYLDDVDFLIQENIINCINF